MTKLRFLIAVLLAASCFAAVPAMAKDGLEERAFAEQAMAEIAAAFPDAKVSMAPDDPLQINIASEGQSDPKVVNLHRLHNYCRSLTPAECAAEQTRFIAVLAKTTGDIPPEAKNLRVIVRDAEYMQYVLRSFPKGAPHHKPIGTDLFALLAFDSPEAIALAAPDKITGLGLTVEQAWALASEQTAARRPAFASDEAIGGELLAFQGEEYMGSMLVDDRLWTGLAAANGPDLAVIASSDQLVIAAIVPTGDPLARFRQLAEEQCTLAPRCISPQVYRWRAGAWVIAE